MTHGACDNGGGTPDLVCRFPLHRASQRYTLYLWVADRKLGAQA